MKAWAADDGATYEDALADGGRTGASAVFSLPTGNLGTPPSLPSYLVGLTSFQLRVGGPPRIATAPSPVTVAVGATARFSVVAEGFPAPRFQWRGPLGDLPGATTATLELPGVTPADAGPYSVRVYNNLGETFSEPVALTVLEPPRITGLTRPRQSSPGTPPS